MVFAFGAAGDFSCRDDCRVADLATALIDQAPAAGRAPSFRDSTTGQNSLEQAALRRQHIAADLAEILEDDAEHDRDPGGHVAAADPRLRHRGDERHAFVLIDAGHRRIEAHAV